MVMAKVERPCVKTAAPMRQAATHPEMNDHHMTAGEFHHQVLGATANMFDRAAGDRCRKVGSHHTPQTRLFNRHGKKRAPDRGLRQNPSK